MPTPRVSASYSSTRPTVFTAIASAMLALRNDSPNGYRGDGTPAVGPVAAIDAVRTLDAPSWPRTAYAKEDPCITVILAQSLPS